MSLGGRRSGAVLGSLEGAGGAFVDRAGGGAVSAVSERKGEEGEIYHFFCTKRGSSFKDKGPAFSGKESTEGTIKISP